MTETLVNTDDLNSEELELLIEFFTSFSITLEKLLGELEKIEALRGSLLAELAELEEQNRL